MDHAEGHQVDDVVQCPTNMHKPVSSVARVSFEHCGRKVEKKPVILGELRSQG